MGRKADEIASCRGKERFADFDRALKINGNFSAGYYNRGNAFYQKRDLDKAIANYSAAIKLNPKDAAEHVLQLCNSTKRPPSDTRLNELVQRHECAVCFDLVPEKRVEG